MPDRISAACILGGWMIAAVGVALWSPPAALVLAGLIVVGVGVSNRK